MAEVDRIRQEPNEGYSDLRVGDQAASVTESLSPAWLGGPRRNLLSMFRTVLLPARLAVDADGVAGDSDLLRDHAGCLQLFA
jgi:hypothetical protein